MRALVPFVLLLGGCTALAPFGGLTTGDLAADAGDAGAPSCADAGAYAYDAGPPVDAGAGVEVCNRRDDDGDVRVDENVLRVGAPMVVETVGGVGEHLRASEGLRPDTVVAAFTSSAASTRGRLRVAEVRIGGGVHEALVGDGPVGAFDVATGVDGYVVAWSEAGEVRLAVVGPCASVGPTRTLAMADASHVRVATSVDGTEAFVVWVAGGVLAGVRVGLVGEPAVGPVAVLEGPMHSEAAVAVAASSGWVAAVERRAGGDAVVLRSLSREGVFGPGVELDTSLIGAGPLSSVSVTTDPEDFLILAVHLGDGAVRGPGFAQEIRLPAMRLQAARRYGGEARILDAANDGSASSGLLLELGGDFAVERVGANPDGFLSTDPPEGVPVLTRLGWLALVGFREGPYRFVVVGRDAAGALQLQPIACP